MGKRTLWVEAAGLCAGILLLFIFMAPAVAQPAFEDVAPQLGLNQTGSCGGPFWVDIDGDGDQDLCRMHRFGEPSVIYRNDGDHFTPMSSGIGLPQDADAGGVNPMDFDHDGDLDLFTHCYSTNFELLVNENGHYVDRTSDLGLDPRTGGRYRAWIDFNRDGWMDLLLDFSDGWKLYRNDGGQLFTDITANTQLPNITDSYFFAESDFDLDGDVDLYLTVIGGPNRLYVNDGNNAFVDRTVAAGLSGIVGNGACAWVDFNHDKYPDLLTPDGNHHGIYINNGDGTFHRLNVHGTDVPDWGDFPQGCLYGIADFDMDGDQDIYVCRPGGCGMGQAPNQFLRQDSINATDIWFTDMAPRLGMDFLEDGYPCVVDYDGDGDMDLYIASQDQPDHLFRNNLNSTVNRLEVKVLGPNGEQDKWLTRVEVYPHGGQSAITASELNSSNVSRNGFKNYLVLDENGHYDLRIYFASGAVMTPDVYPQLSDVVPSQINHLLTVYQGQMAGTPEGSKLAKDFRLDAVYPNPFNSTATIRYSLPASEYVRLGVYDVLGRHVNDLVNGSVSAGEHNMSWNASGVSSGIYFLRLQAGRQVAQQKALLLK